MTALKGLLLPIFLCIFANLASAQIQGTIRDEKGESLPYATVVIKGTSRGTSANGNGVYSLDLEPGTYTLVFQYIGYQQLIRKVDYPGGDFPLSVQLKEQDLNLSEVVVNAGKEDPAYAVIRKAQAKRKYYRDLISEYSVNAYIKGIFKMIDAPTKFMGIEIGDMDGALDTNRQGIIYLSETVSQVHYQRPEKKKEIIISSKVSGEDRGVSFNRALAMDFDLYQEHVSYGRQIVSPISPVAMNFYKYKLLGIFTNGQGVEVNKIELIPIRSEDPVFRGIIYIVEDSWNIYSSDVYLTKGAMKNDLLDTLRITQTYIKLEEPDVWQQFNQTLYLRAGILGFKFNGNFTAVFSDYNLKPEFGDKFFSREVIRYEDNASKKDSAYWESVRPIPLTAEELSDYIKKDSIQDVLNSPAYKDSVERRSNRFTYNSFIGGYSHDNWRKNSTIYTGPLITTLGFHPVTGFSAGLNGGWIRRNDSIPGLLKNLEFKYRYGFSDRISRVEGTYIYQEDAIRKRKWQITAGWRALDDFNENSTIEFFRNSWRGLFYADNYKKVYEQDYVRLGQTQEWATGLTGSFVVEWNNRRTVRNNTEYTFNHPPAEYEPNNVIDATDVPLPMTDHQVVSAGLRVNFKPGQRFQILPGRKVNMGSKWPMLQLRYKVGKYLDASEDLFQHIEFSIRENSSSLGHWGNISWRAGAGFFPGNAAMQFADFKHFNGNRVLIMHPGRYLDSYKTLPYYSWSTAGPYAEFSVEHNFYGFLFDKIPLLKKARLTEIVGANLIWTEDKGNRAEFSFGIDRLGFGPLRAFRLDVAAALENGNYKETRLILGTQLLLGGGDGLGRNSTSIRL